MLLTFALSYFIVLQWLPIGVLGKKAALWSILGIPGIWWIDLQIDGVKKGYEQEPKITVLRMLIPVQLAGATQRSSPATRNNNRVVKRFHS